MQVADLNRALGCYHALLGFEGLVHMGTAAFLSADGCHHHIGLTTWHRRGGKPAVREGGTGLYHAAMLNQERAALARVLRRLLDAGYPLRGAADHGVREALYLDDPDGNGPALSWDQPRAAWPLDAPSKLTSYPHLLNVQGLLKLAE